MDIAEEFADEPEPRWLPPAAGLGKIGASVPGEKVAREHTLLLTIQSRRKEQDKQMPQIE